MSQMLAEIQRIVFEDLGSRVTQYDVLYEGITNAIQANATHIQCILSSNDNALADDNGIEMGRRKLDNFTLIDNGDGFTTDNYDSFCKYRTNYKKELGCKGIGRFTFIKVYQNVNFSSRLVETQEVKEFPFNFNFDTDNITSKPAAVDENRTEIAFSSLASTYFDLDRGNDKRIYLDLEIVKEKVLSHLIPLLFFYKKEKNVSINIDFIDQFTQRTTSITDSDIPNFELKEFTINDKFGTVHNFKLYYSIIASEGTLFSFYCGNGRTVCEFSDKDLKISLPSGNSGYLLLVSDYFNERVDTDRNDFDIFPIKIDAFSSLSWEIINNAIKLEIKDLIKSHFPESETINKEKLKSIEEERPYLLNYIDEQDIELVGFLDKKAIIDKAKKSFDLEKEKVLKNAGKSTYTNTELNEAIQLAQSELISYINDRVMVLDRLQKLVNEKEKVEEIIHNLFMQKGQTDDYFSIGKNNLWLIDDRFTSYSYAASDKKIKDTIAHIDTIENDKTKKLNDEPDLALFFSSDPNQSEKLKSVLIEIKSFDYDSKSSRKKFQGIHQLRDYVKAFKISENVDEIYGFLITDVDEQLAQDLTEDNYTALFSTKDPIYHRFYDKIGVSIYVVSARTLINDAHARNRVFLDIIRKHSRLHKIIEN